MLNLALKGHDLPLTISTNPSGDVSYQFALDFELPIKGFNTSGKAFVEITQDQYDILKDVNGTIYNLSNSNSGKVIQSGEVIMEIIPDGVPLEVEAKVLNRDIGFIHLD